MRYAKPTLRDSFFGWLGVSTMSPPIDLRDRQREIRQRMIEELLYEPRPGFGSLASRIDGALDVESLWYQRMELMQALGRTRGEEYAAATLAQITALFDGLLPRTMMSQGQGARLH